jgi:hypothetical protein
MYCLGKDAMLLHKEHCAVIKANDIYTSAKEWKLGKKEMLSGEWKNTI